MKESQTPWDAIGAYLKNQSDKQNEAIVKAWLNESAENIELFRVIVDTQLITRQVPDFYEPDMEKLWAELITRVQPKQKGRKIILLPLLKYAVAAAILVFVFIAGRWFSGDKAVEETMEAYSTVYAAPGQRTQLVLPDSTKVWLNSGSSLKYATNFNFGEREVFISGEGYFEVTKNKRKPFVVHANDLQVKVLGTHFNVKEDLKHQVSEVTLVEGKVQVLDDNAKSLTYLAPGEQLKMKDRHYSVEKTDNPEALIAWTQGVLVFKDKPFGEVIEYLESWYGVSIQLEESLYDNHRYTFKLMTESLREMLDLISEITPIQYEIEGEQVYIKTKRNS
ncbi:FecR family protein [Mangrovibacterium sp.]|uniref:FecR family protein n=1 Tax=Mangrovibacterium sp. TaxID=1961364 RepID=UPI003564913A